MAAYDSAPELLAAFREASRRVPAYRTLLAEAGIAPEKIESLEDFQRLPVTDKRSTFQRFPIEQLCLDGQLGRLASVLTSSGHSGVFAFGLTDAAALPATVKGIDDVLDSLFQVRALSTLLINCLPMGVKIPTEVCTLAETSVRPDMAVGLVKAFGRHFQQIVLVGETAFIKLVLELGRRSGVAWQEHLVHVIVGEEPLAENARKYLETLLHPDARRTDGGKVISSMGVAEAGLNLFYEAPPHGVLAPLRRALHENRGLRAAVLGACDWVPSLFTYDPRRIFVEFDAEGRLLLTTLAPGLRLPLLRYMTGDRGARLELTPDAQAALESAGIAPERLQAFPVVEIRGRGEHALAGDAPVYPEAVKEGLYHDPQLAALATGNFRLRSGPLRVLVRVQLSPEVKTDGLLQEAFQTAVSHYVPHPVEVVCESYETFGNGMSLDYERKFSYVEQ